MVDRSAAYGRSWFLHRRRFSQLEMILEYSLVGVSLHLISICWLYRQSIRAFMGSGTEITPEECLVFEDSVPGIEAGRRAGMRVVWCPHPGLLGEYQGREKEVLAGKTGEHKDEEVIDNAGPSTIAGSPGHVGEVDDGWAEFVPSLEGFDFKKYGIDIVEQRYRT